jgi:A/G-specific adenine glycosylase
MTFTKKLIKWYLDNKRDLPWRDLTNPYPIWLSEIILQQTRVAQGLPYFEAFFKHFPTVFDLANAQEEQVLKLWQGLGYYSRARNLHQTAKIVAFEMNGVFPTNYNDLLQLKGIGTYTAAAIASFAYNETVPVVDGNVFRVLSRFFNIENDISLNATKKVFWDLANELIPEDNPAIFNQAIMEFGALQCVPKNPDCMNCIFNDRCAALQLNKVAVLPIKLKKTVVKNRFFNYLIYIDKNHQTKVEQRIHKDIWQNLFQFPLIETEKSSNFTEISQKIDSCHEIIAIDLMNINDIIHKLTHQKLHLKFWKIEINDFLKDGINFENLIKLPFPIVIFDFIEDINISKYLKY